MVLNLNTRRVRSITLGLCTAILSLHFACTILWVLPANPVQARLGATLSRYILPYFGQNWRLFAPDPSIHTQALLARCRYLDPSGVHQESEWIDVSTPLWEAKYKNRLSPADRLYRVQRAAEIAALGDFDPFVARLRERASETSDPDLVEIISQLDRNTQEEARRHRALLARVLSAYCDEIFGPRRTEEVRGRIANLPLPKFSRRHEPFDTSQMTVIDLDWMTYQPVAPIRQASHELQN
ncbi:MAG: hypothetical protein KC636_28590 [Myxococcales bacterium]|nr:hypothetical protein [Myxococcales bacterium]